MLPIYFLEKFCFFVLCITRTIDTIVVYESLILDKNVPTANTRDQDGPDDGS